METWDIIDNERAAFADLADSLTPAQWDQQSLCNKWKVRDVVAHVTEGSNLGGGKAVVTMVKYGFRLNTMLEREAIKDGAAPPEELRKELRETVGKRSTPPGVKAGGMLLDEVVHQQDVRRPLNIPRTVSPEALRAVLDEAVKQRTGLLPGKKRSAGITLRATDIGWEHGDGPEVTGPGEAILMAVAGRSAALADLSGPGLGTLRERVSG